MRTFSLARPPQNPAYSTLVGFLPHPVFQRIIIFRVFIRSTTPLLKKLIDATGTFDVVV